MGPAAAAVVGVTLCDPGASAGWQLSTPPAKGPIAFLRQEAGLGGEPQWQLGRVGWPAVEQQGGESGAEMPQTHTRRDILLTHLFRLMNTARICTAIANACFIQASLRNAFVSLFCTLSHAVTHAEDVDQPKNSTGQ